jgi:hypothetical protein
MSWMKPDALRAWQGGCKPNCSLWRRNSMLPRFTLEPARGAYRQAGRFSTRKRCLYPDLGRRLARTNLPAAGIQYIPPEMREDEGEIEIASAGKLTQPVELADIRGMTHCHTVYSDGRNSIEEMALAAEAMGMTYLTITDHSPSARYAGGVGIDRLRAQWDEIARVQQRSR